MIVGKFDTKVVVAIIVGFVPAKTKGWVAQHLLISTGQELIEEQLQVTAFLKIRLHFGTLETEKACSIFSFVGEAYLLPFFFVFLHCFLFLFQRRLRAL